MKSLTLGVIVATLCSVIALPAVAADAFTVTVPVEFKSMHPDIKTVRVACRIMGPDPVTKKERPYGDASPHRQDLTLVNGNYAGPAQLVFVFKTEEFTPQEQANLASATRVYCNFGLVTANGSQYTPQAGSTAGPAVAVKPGTKFSEHSYYNFPK